MLADVNIEELPLDVLLAMQKAIEAEIRYRETYSELKWEELDAVSRQSIRWKGFPGCLPVALPPEVRRLGWRKRLPYLGNLLIQDWECCFPSADDKRRDFYVYAHVDPRSKPVLLPRGRRLRGEPFYIGKGTGQRAWDLKRNQGHGKRIRAIRDAGFAESAIVDILDKELTERQALSLEAKLIYFFGSIYEEIGQGILVNLADQTRPTFVHNMEIIVLDEEKSEAKIAGEAKRLTHKDRRQQLRWQGWQETLINQTLLSKEYRSMGYTVAIIPPIGRDIFLDVVKLIETYQRLERRKDRQAQAAMREIWERWARWTGHVANYIERLYHRKPATLPRPPFTL